MPTENADRNIFDKCNKVVAMQSHRLSPKASIPYLFNTVSKSLRIAFFRLFLRKIWHKHYPPCKKCPFSIPLMYLIRSYENPSALIIFSFDDFHPWYWMIRIVYFLDILIGSCLNWLSFSWIIFKKRMTTFKLNNPSFERWKQGSRLYRRFLWRHGFLSRWNLKFARLRCVSILGLKNLTESNTMSVLRLERSQNYINSFTFFKKHCTTNFKVLLIPTGKRS